VSDTTDNANGSDKQITRANLVGGLQAQPAEGAFADGDKTKLDGIEASADVTDATNVNAAGATMNTDTDVSANSWVVDEDTMVSDLNTKVPTQQSVKAYVDTTAGSPEGTAILSTGEIGGNKFLREDGDGTSSWQAIPGGGDMLASTYDTDADGRVDVAETVTLQVFNNTGGTITEGSVVYISGWNVPNTLPEVSDAQSNSASTMPAIGIVNADITTGNEGYITTSGLIEGKNTSAYTTGDNLYVDPTTAGALTTTKPTGANLIQKIGTVGRSNVSNGTILVSGANRSNDVPNFTAADKYWYGGTSGVNTEGDITAAGRAILDDADAAAQRTTLGVDAAGTDNSTDVTLAGTNTYLTITGQEITRGDIPVTALADGTDGELITWDATGVPATVAVGTSGHVLTSNGTGAAPTFQAAAGGGSSTEYATLLYVDGNTPWTGSGFVTMTVNSATTTMSTCEWRCSSNTTVDSISGLIENWYTAAQTSVNFWDRQLRWNGLFSVDVNTSSATDTFFGCHDDEISASSWPINVTDKHVGVYCTVSAGVATWYATNANGTTQTTTDITSYMNQASSTGLYERIRIDYDGVNDEIKYYINGTLRATHTTNIPTGVSANGQVLLFLHGNTTGTVDNQARLVNMSLQMNVGTES